MESSLPMDLGVALTAPESGPKPVASLLKRRLPLAESAEQLRVLAAAPLVDAEGERVEFELFLAACGHAGLRPATLDIFQVNMGKLCNMSCRHCHVDASPERVAETMNRQTVDACLRALDQTPAHTVDITGGAPELNPHFPYLVEQAVSRGKHVIDRCNLTVLLIPKFRRLPQWLAERGVEVVCSLPHHRRSNTDAQRGQGAFDKSIEALRRLNEAGYGRGDPARILTLMANPAGAFLAGPQRSMEREWKASLAREHGVCFDRLIALNNMPIARYLEWLIDSDNFEAYMRRLLDSFNPATVEGLMCRNTISVSWDGRVFDCDFNQMLDMEAKAGATGPQSIQDFDPAVFAARQIRTARHCFGCTAGAGSSCGGATA